MLPDLRQLVAMTCLALSVLIFAFGAAALLRSAHDDFAALQSQRAGREPGRAQFALNHGAAPALQISDAVALSGEHAAASEPNLAALQLPNRDTAEPPSAHAAIIAKMQDKPAIADSGSTLTITDRAAAPASNLPGNDAIASRPPSPAQPEQAAAIKDVALIKNAEADNKAKDSAAINGGAVDQAQESDKAQASDKDVSAKDVSARDVSAKDQISKDLAAKDRGAQVRIAALNPSGSARSVSEQPAPRTILRRAKKPAAHAAQSRKRILAARQRAAQAARPAPQQAATNNTPSGNLFIQGGN